jgi:AcrR family transcriptional regulator
MARRREHSLDEIKEMVLSAAEAIIIKEGFSALTVRKIAVKIGYTVASIYMVFINMADLILHIKSNTIDDLNRQLQLVPNSGSEQYITDLARTYLYFAVKNFNRWSMIYSTEFERNEAYQHKLNDIYSRIEAQLALLAPEYSTTRQCKQAARVLWCGIHGICSLSLIGNPENVDINDVENSIVLLVESFISGWVKIIVVADHATT